MEEILKETEIIRGIVERITYSNPSNGYTVAVLNTKDGQITVVGGLPFVQEGDDVEVAGEYVVHSTYGLQLKVATFEKMLPTTVASVLRYLSSGTVKGVGPATARKIVEMFGERTMDVLKDSPEELSRIQGISKEKALNIGAAFTRQFGIRDVLLLLRQFNITDEDAMRVFKVLGADSLEKIKSNPYILCCEGIDFPFEKAEEIADGLGIPNDSSYRYSAGILYILKRNMLNGHTCLPKSKLIKVSCGMLSCSDKQAVDTLSALAGTFEIYLFNQMGEEFVALPICYNAERYCASRLSSMCLLANGALDVDISEVNYIENFMGITLDEKQRNAIFEAMSNAVFILTGGPGTGKTTTLRAMIEMFEYRGLTIDLAAPTGRAAKRITELTGREAKTLHRLLEVEWTQEDKPIFSKNERNPLDSDVIIIDEVSMVDSLLFESLLRAMRLDCKLILVGDSDQLPSVSAGNVLNDLILSDRFAAVRLDKIFRQAEKSNIVNSAHAIIKGNMPNVDLKDSDFFFLKRSDSELAVNTVVELCKERLPVAYGFDDKKDIQVLTPSRMMSLGTLNLNNNLQEALNYKNLKGQKLYYKGFYFCVGDKVMQVKNNYEINWVSVDGEVGAGIFNGDVGYVISVDFKARTMKVQFDDKIVTYNSESLSQLELAYAITVHKSQGSEFNCVILPLFDVPSKLCYRNLLYTAVTRAKKLLIIVGKTEIMAAMIQNDKKTLRYTMLRDFLKDVDYEAFPNY